MPRPNDIEHAQKRAMEAQLGREQIIWLATSRADGRPHLVPMWFVWHDERIYLWTTAGSQKMTNLERNRRAALSLPDTTNVLIIEGVVNFPRGAVIDLAAREFLDKYGWDPLDDQQEPWRLVEIIPTKVLAWSNQ